MKNNTVIIVALAIVVIALVAVIYQQNAKPKTPGQEIASGVGHALENTGDSIQRASH